MEFEKVRKEHIRKAIKAFRRYRLDNDDENLINYIIKNRKSLDVLRYIKNGGMKNRLYDKLLAFAHEIKMTQFHQKPRYEHLREILNWEIP